MNFMNMRLSIIISLILVLSIFSCKSDQKNTLTTDRITTHLSESPKGLNPLIYQTAADQAVSSLLFLNFADYNPSTLAFEPIMIKALPKPVLEEEGTYKGMVRFDMEIIPEAKWKDGTQITGHDYEFSLKSIMHPKTKAVRYRAYLANLLDCKIAEDNPKKISVYLKENSIAAMELVSSIPLLQKSVYDPSNSLQKASVADFKNEEIYNKLASENAAIDSFASSFNSVKYSREIIGGNGRYELKEWLSDQHVVLKKVKNHWADDRNNPLTNAIAEEIVFILTPDEAASFTQLKAGVFDIYPGLTFQQMNSLQSGETYKDQFYFHVVKLPRYYFLQLNTRKKVLQEKAVRQAISQLMNVDTIIASYENGFAERINSMFFSIENKSKIADIKFDRSAANKLLNDAGWKDTNDNDILDKKIDGELVELEISVLSTGSQLGKLISGVMKQEMLQSGIKINVETIDRTMYKQRLNNLNFDITLSAKGQSLAPYDPYPMLHTDNTDPGESNMVNFGNEETDALIELIRSTQDEVKRDEAYLALEKKLYDEQALIFLYSPTEKIAIKKGVNGVLSRKKPGFSINTFYKE